MGENRVTMTGGATQGRLFLLYFLPLLLLGILLFTFILWEEDEHFRELLAANESLQLELASRSITRDLETILPDIDLLTGSTQLKTFAFSQSDTAREQLLEEWLTFLRQKRQYSVLRLIDTQGKERLRVDRYHGGLRVLEEHELQDKSHRYYFSEAIALGPGELYISPMDLEMERGKVLQPPIPMIRFAMPLFDAEGNKHGVFVISYMAERLLDHFEEMLGASRGHVSLLNGEGYWLRSLRDPDREWGFSLGHDWTYEKAHPEAWTEIRDGDRGQFERGEHLFSFRTLYPLEVAGGYKAEDDGDHQGHYHIDPRSYRWKVVSDIDPVLLQQVMHQHLFGLPLAIGLLLMGLAALGVWLRVRMQYERRRLHRQLALDALVVEATTDGVFITDAERRILSVNDGFSRITGYDEAEVLGRTPRYLSAGFHDAKLLEGIWRSLEIEGRWQGEVSNRRKDGGLYHEWLSLRRVEDERGGVLNYVGIFSDITARKREEQQLKHRAHHDALTGLPNRTLMEDRLRQILAHCRRGDGRAALMFIDLDRFKPINDEYGHEAGDAVLREVAARLSAVVREEDTVARLGGDEFVVLAGDGRSIDNLRALAERLLLELRRPFDIDGISCRISASIGVALFPDHGEEGDTLLKHADEAMYRIKQQGRDGVAFYEEG